MLTAIWQPSDVRERDWICDLFGACISNHVYDGKHTIVQDDCIVFDNFIHKKPTDYYKQFEMRHNVFLFHLSDEHYHDGYDAYRYFDGVFRNYWSSAFDASILQLPLGYSNGIKGSGVSKLSSEREFHWSFVGETRRSSRPEMVRALSRIKPNYCHATDAASNQSLVPAAYRRILEESVFAPSPMGRLNLECFRMYEALECGSIPIVEKRLALDYYSGLLGPNPLPAVTRWSQAPRLMSDLLARPDKVDAMQAEVAHWWKSKKEALEAQVFDMIQNREGRARGHAPKTQGFHDLPFWQVLELGRHHSVLAMARRFKLEALRIALPSHRQGSAK